MFFVVRLSGLYTPFVYVSQKAREELGATEKQGSYIIVVLGVFNTVSRVATGLVADHPRIDPVTINNVAAILMGVTTALVSVLNSYGLLMGYAAVFGVVMGQYIIFGTTD